MVSHRDNWTCPQGKGRPKCEHCDKLGHKIDKYYALHGRPRSAAVVQTDLSPPSFPRDLPSSVSSDTLSMFNKFLKWYKDQ